MVSLFLSYQDSDSLISTPNIAAFTHPKFFYSIDCKCGMFNPNFFQLQIYNKPSEVSVPYERGNLWIIPPSFEAGYSVIITGKQNDFFRIKFNEEENLNPIYYDFTDSNYYVKKGALGTWIYNYNSDTKIFESVPLYKEPCRNSKIITQIKKEDCIVIILDTEENWVFVETITKGKKKRGWLDPKMQCGSAYGLSYPLKIVE